MRARGAAAVRPGTGGSGISGQRAHKPGAPRTGPGIQMTKREHVREPGRCPPPTPNPPPNPPPTPHPDAPAAAWKRDRLSGGSCHVTSSAAGIASRAASHQAAYAAMIAAAIAVHDRQRGKGRQFRAWIRGISAGQPR